MFKKPHVSQISNKKPLYSTNLYHCSKGLGKDTLIPAYFNGIRNCSRMEKKISRLQILCCFTLFCVQYFFVCLFTGHDEKNPRMIQSYIF